MTTITMDEITRNARRGGPQGPRERPAGFVGKWSDLSLEERFWAKVDRRGLDECWPWLSGMDGHGYGLFHVCHRHLPAHRFAYEATIGPIPAGLQIDHLCRNRSCVNPRHLEPVTRRENLMRGVCPSAIAARKTHCPQGHPYSPENTWRRANGNRTCKQCRNAHNRRWWASRKARVA